MATHLVGWVRGGLGAWEDNKWELMLDDALGRAGAGGVGAWEDNKGELMHGDALGRDLRR